MNLKINRRNLHAFLVNGLALTSMLGGMILTAVSVEAIPVRTEANLDRGTGRISVDLYRFVKKEYQDNRVNPKCKGDLESGELIIKCDVSEYVEGGSVFPFSTPDENPNLNRQERN